LQPLRGKAALVTGGSRGTGRAIALELAELGADVAVTARTVVEGSELPGTIGETRNLIEDHGVRSVAVAADMKEPDEVTQVVEEVLEAFGRCDILVNNASDTGDNVFRDFWETPPELWNGQVQLNVNAMYALMWGLAPSMKENGGGFMINIGSAKEPPGRLVPGGMRLNENTRIGAAYLTTKVAIYAMSSFVAQQLAEDNIVVTCVNPGGAASEAHYHHMEKLGIEPHPTPMAMPVKTVGYIVTCEHPLEEFAGQYVNAVEFAQEKGLARLEDA
jgi:NAD(P)-dependent dehydrogenase (short-subunit alcohol dehydrogenase family)